MAGRGYPRKKKRFPPLRFNSPSSSKTEQPSRHYSHTYLKPVAVQVPAPLSPSVPLPPPPPMQKEASPPPPPPPPPLSSIKHVKAEVSPPPPPQPPHSTKHVKKEASPPKRLSPRKIRAIDVMPMWSAEPANNHQILEVSPPEGFNLRSADAVSSKHDLHITSCRSFEALPVT